MDVEKVVAGAAWPGSGSMAISDSGAIDRRISLGCFAKLGEAPRSPEHEHAGPGTTSGAVSMTSLVVNLVLCLSLPLWAQR
jgi:hypothetical protein